METVNPKALDKIRSDLLREDALHEENSAHTVLVEVGVPLPTVQRAKSSSITIGRPRLRVSSPQDDAAGIEAAKRAVEQALGHKAERYLPSSRTFVVEATGRELRRIAELPSVVAIWPNRSFGF